MPPRERTAAEQDARGHVRPARPAGADHVRRAQEQDQIRHTGQRPDEPRYHVTPPDPRLTVVEAPNGTLTASPIVPVP